MKTKYGWIVCLALLFCGRSLQALVKYDEGNIFIKGVMLLQDAQDEKRYFYLPPFPRVAVSPVGKLEFLAIKYLDPEGKTNGGLLHFLADLNLPENIIEELRTELKKKMPGADIAGPVPLLEGSKDEEDKTSFKVVSAVLSGDKTPAFTHTLITSGHAPLTPGSKSAVAALLDEKGATLLFETLSGPTSDVSVSIHAYYEAMVRSYNAKIFADISTVYKHFSSVLNRQKGYTKRELRDIVDELQRKAVIKVEILDRGDGTGADTKAMDRITGLVTDKIVNLMFDAQTGLSKLPEKEKALQDGQIPGRQQASWFSRTFLGGSGNPEYITDNQYVMKNREDIQQNIFMVNLTKNSTIRVPLDISGNMGGIYKNLKDNKEHVRIVNLKDPAFQKREIFFKIDGDYTGCFEDTVNFVTVNFRKKYPDQPDLTAELIFNHKAVKDGTIVQPIPYPRLGIQDSSWENYEYRVGWSIFDRETVYVPPAADAWQKGNAPAVVLTPPFTKTAVDIDMNLPAFENGKIHSGIVEFRCYLGNSLKSGKKAVFRASDTETIKSVTLYHDRGKTPEYRVTWYEKASGSKSDAWKKLDSTYLFLSPPLAADTGKKEGEK